MHENVDRPPGKTQKARYERLIFAVTIKIIVYFTFSRLDLNDFVNCPMCRGEFGKIMDLNREILSNKDTIIHKAKLKPREEGSLMNFPRQNEFSAIHPDTYCSDCTFSPIVGRIYELRNHTDSTILNNAKLLLCIKCFERRITCRFESETAEKCSFFWKDVSY